MNIHTLSDEIITLHEHCITKWKQAQEINTESMELEAVQKNHWFNYQLWHAEDKARRDDKGFKYVYQAKRAIDGFNQQRNNQMEIIDEWLYHFLKPELNAQIPVHSETPGMMIDRLSILSLKAYHMHEQVVRDDANDHHKKQCQIKLDVIMAQKKQLAHCLTTLLQEVLSKSRTFKVYHQFKMYNDPQLNPELYNKNN